MYLDGLGFFFFYNFFFLNIFVQIYFFTLVEKIWGQKITFLAIFQKYDF